MHDILTLSLPKEMTVIIKDQVRSGRFASTSEFFRHILRQWQDNQLVSAVINSKREFSTGKGKRLRTLKDLR